ncbi:hypothetical protein D8674_010373 [Pyrus ussuriensis x Pyrus communis]|uniref:CCHC-type domain-containing protein n=1 Tax=Pyrus ussuriensis x Pyrus communis TaxID=2448454 RepID=A0A5N5FFU1_9ROSA|nr:hypothetical protein D8674_010373 [Pyrus ussuriensis x Pyrus communis]
MLESKPFSAFFEKVEILTNEALGLGKPIDETTVKVAIQEFQNLNEIKLGKLVGKLITYEMELDMDESDSKKRKELALQIVENCEVVGDILGHCFACRGSGHRAADCANTKLLSQKHKKAIMVTWSDNNDQGSMHSNELSDNEEKVDQQKTNKSHLPWKIITKLQDNLNRVGSTGWKKAQKLLPWWSKPGKVG